MRLFSELLFWASAGEIVFWDPDSFSTEPLLMKAFRHVSICSGYELMDVCQYVPITGLFPKSELLLI